MEQRFVISAGGRETPCLLCAPDFGEPQRIVIGVHGIGGSMHDAIQESIAEEMELFNLFPSASTSPPTVTMTRRS